MKEGFIGAWESIRQAGAWAFSCMEHLLVFILAFFISVFTEYRELIQAVLVCSIIDWFLAVIYNFKKYNILSSKMLKFVGKMITYGIAFIVAYVVNKLLGIEVVGDMITIVIVLAELHSLVTNARLLFPDNQLLKFLDKFIEKEKKSKINELK